MPFCLQDNYDTALKQLRYDLLSSNSVSFVEPYPKRAKLEEHGEETTIGPQSFRTPIDESANPSNDSTDCLVTCSTPIVRNPVRRPNQHSFEMQQTTPNHFSISTNLSPRIELAAPDVWIDEYVQGLEQPDKTRVLKKTDLLGNYDGSPLKRLEWSSLFKELIHDTSSSPNEN